MIDDGTYARNLALGITAGVAVVALLVGFSSLRKGCVRGIVFICGVIWRLAVAPAVCVSPMIGWDVLGKVFAAFGESYDAPPLFTFDRFCVWTTVGLITYGAVGRGVRTIGDFVRNAWKDSHPSAAPGDGGEDSGPSSAVISLATVRHELGRVITVVNTHTKAVETHKRRFTKLTKKIEELEAQLAVIDARTKTDAPTDGEEV